MSSALPDEPEDPARRDVEIRRFRAGSAGAARDAVATEEPLEIQLGNQPLAVMMRTPGHDAELALGLLVSERVVSGPEDVLSLRHCTLAPDPAAEDNVIRARLRPDLRVDLERLRRNLFASASCGVCGKATIENALAHAPPLHDDPSRFPAALLESLPERLRAAQPTFDRTGGLHAAGLFDAEGRLLVAREDVGRHNAVDKVIGWSARAGRLPLRGHVIMVSGRISYEIVQKALAARVPLLAAVSAPTSLAIELATSAGMALAGFLRGRGFNLYGERSRVVG